MKKIVVYVDPPKRQRLTNIQDANQNKIAASEGHFNSLATFVKKLSDRTVGVVNNGLVCNELQGPHGVHVYVGHHYLAAGNIQKHPQKS